MQRELYEKVTQYVSKTYNKALRNKKHNMCLIFLLIIMQRMVTSSTAAVRQSLERRLEILKTQRTKLGSLTEADLAELDIEEGVQEALEAISIDTEEEIAELEQLIAIAKQAEFQHHDAKVEHLLDTIDELLSADKEQKIIIFTEFVATQNYLQRILSSRGYSITTLNGSMGIEERNEAFAEFHSKTNIFISTDAGSEGLNLQFSNIIINYDLPWNPMKIEQRCGRADRIGQKRDVHVYNFILEDTVENRVRQVLEEKLSVILNELGVDKYSDVLDGEVAECDFTEVYMRSISKPNRIEEALYPVESEMKQQLANALQYKEVIREEKDLIKLVGQESNFDIESALRTLLTYYDAWKGNDLTIIDRVGINDPAVTQRLKEEINQDRFSPLMSVDIKNFPNEAGYFMLWELSLTDDENDKRIIPIFINEQFVLRPVAGKRIMQVLLDSASKLTVHNIPNLGTDIYEQLEQMSMDFSYDTFTELKEKYLQKAKESHSKYMYALELRLEAAKQIGIENIRNSRIARLEREKKTIEDNYKKGQKVCPDFKLVLLVKLEA